MTKPPETKTPWWMFLGVLAGIIAIGIYDIIHLIVYVIFNPVKTILFLLTLKPIRVVKQFLF